MMRLSPLGRPVFALFTTLLVGCSSEAPNEASTSGVGGSGATAAANATATSAEATSTSASSGGGGKLDLGTPVVIATAAEGLDSPRDLAFAPDHPDQLWIVNEATNGVVILTSPGAPEQFAETRVDFHAGHFMARPSALAFGIENRFATSSESRDDYNCGPQAEDDFMGPTYWSADLDIFAVIGQTPCQAGKPEGSHLDMLHGSPLAMGIEHEADGMYWVADGLNGEIVRYDFAEPHDPGGGDHSDGAIRRFPEATITYLPGVPSHLARDPHSASLYVADAGENRIMRLDTQSGSVSGTASSPPNWDGLSEYVNVKGVTWETVAIGIEAPSGIAVVEGYLFVTESGTGDIIALDFAGNEVGRRATGAKGLMGITVGPDGKLWCVNGLTNQLLRLD